MATSCAPQPSPAPLPRSRSSQPSLPCWRLNTQNRLGYGWPVKPFDRQHPIRGFFGDPRIGETPTVSRRSFHFGVDVSAPDGTPVYATITGTVVWEPERPETISIRSADGTVFAYWHIVPAIRDGSAATAYRTLLGHIAKGWEHVHFAEFRDGHYLNPLRPGALAPIPGHDSADRPRLQLRAERRGDRACAPGRQSRSGCRGPKTRRHCPCRAAGAVKPVMPMLVRWRLVGVKDAASAWRTAIDFSHSIPASGSYELVYAPWTRQNKPWRIGRYRLHLARGWDSRTWANGSYRLEVLVVDSRGNRSQLVDAVLASQLSSTSLAPSLPKSLRCGPDSRRHMRIRSPQPPCHGV